MSFAVKSVSGASLDTNSLTRTAPGDFQRFGQRLRGELENVGTRTDRPLVERQRLGRIEPAQ